MSNLRQDVPALTVNRNLVPRSVVGPRVAGPVEVRPWHLGFLRKPLFFEIHEQPWFPRFLRDQITDALQFVLEFGDIYKPIFPRLRAALAESASRTVVDLCSGAGGPWISLRARFEHEAGLPLDILLTDKFPHAGSVRGAGAGGESRIHFHPDSVDATHVPENLKGFRTIFTSFHHFNPVQARAVLQDAVANRQSIAIFEATGRGPLTLLSLLLVPIATLLLLPFQRPLRWSSLIWTYIIPVIPFVIFFDGFISCMRAHSLEDLAELTRGLPENYKWIWGEDRSGRLPIPITYLIGLRQDPSGQSPSPTGA
jgi:hypothetical protein